MPEPATPFEGEITQAVLEQAMVAEMIELSDKALPAAERKVRVERLRRYSAAWFDLEAESNDA